MLLPFNILWPVLGLTYFVSANSPKDDSAITSSKYQNMANSNENDDAYLTQKDNILEKSYHGLIRENETIVEITPLIKVDQEKICDFRILKKPYHEIPFQIDLENNLGILKAQRSLNCEKRKGYHFEILAVYCDGTPSNIANVHITVIDINEYVPIFLQPSYVTEVDEGRLYNEIIRVEATDKDCTPLFGDVCKYEILNNDGPFTINNEGSIKNTEPLSHKTSHNHILSVIAYDCAMKESAPVMVSIKVRRVCEAKFSGLPERIDYIPASKETLQLFPNARLDLCDINCNAQDLKILTSIALQTKHISFGCDRDISNCSAGTSFINLLPRNAEWTKGLNYDEGVEPVFHFDGSSGAIVPDSVLPQHDFSTKPISIVTIFRHGSQLVNNKHVKEHIVCSADNHKMNRHHMALFIRNCRLILLIRKNFNEGDLNIFSPAEWRWKIPQVCDNEWHQYVLNVDQSTKVELYIDGVRFESSMDDRHSNPEVIDDWPLHAAHGVNTTLAVGACFQSSENLLKHNFNGDISEIKVSTSRILSPSYIKCGTYCAEHLLAPLPSVLDSDTMIQTNVQQSDIYIESRNKQKIEQIIQKIQYVNTKQNPTIGRRNIEVRTSVSCMNHSTIRLPTIETYIMVNEPISAVSFPNSANDKTNTKVDDSVEVKHKKSLPGAVGQLNADADMKNYKKITIAGESNSLVSYPEIKSGVHFLEKVNINVRRANKILPQQTLDSCSVIVFPSLNPDHEDIQMNGDESLSSTMNIKTNINKDGVEMFGIDEISNYENVLRSLVYSNKKPAYYLNRVFKLSCTQLNSQFKTTEFTLTLTVLHPKQLTSKANTATFEAGEAAANHNNERYNLNVPEDNASVQATENKVFSYAMINTHDVQEPKSRVHSIVHKAEASHPTLLIILICIFLVLLICGISIARIKNNTQKYTDRHQPCSKIADEGLVWDDSALTITINPMQSEGLSEDSSDSENSDSDDEEVPKDGFAHGNQLEWDNSNIFSTVG